MTGNELPPLTTQLVLSPGLQTEMCGGVQYDKRGGGHPPNEVPHPAASRRWGQGILRGRSRLTSRGTGEPMVQGRSSHAREGAGMKEFCADSCLASFSNASRRVEGGSNQGFPVAQTLHSGPPVSTKVCRHLGYWSSTNPVSHLVVVRPDVD